MKREQAKTIDDYLAAFPPAIRERLETMRAAIRAAAPEASETIKYAIPTFVLRGNLVHFAAFEHHIGFYPTPEGIKKFSRELSDYETSKGAVRFPLDKPLPVALVKRITKFRIQQQMEKEKRLRK